MKFNVDNTEIVLGYALHCIGRILCSCEIVPKELVNRQLSILLLQWNHRLNYEVEITTELTSLQFVDLLIMLNRCENQNTTKERKRDTKKKKCER